MRHEITYILEEEAAASILARLGDLNILHAIHADLTWDEWLNERLGAIQTRDLSPAWGSFIGPKTTQTKVYLSYLLWLIRLPPGHAGVLVNG
jgi:hypothetical protein